MNQLRLWTARILSAVVLFALSSAGQTVVAQSNGPEEGYYFISNAAHPTDALLYNNTGTNQALRVHYANHLVPNKITKGDLPFIFEIKKFGDGYSIRNYEANMYIGKVPDMGFGEGAGFVSEPAEIQIPPSSVVDGSYLIANVKAAPQYGPLLGYQGVFQGEQITGYWGQMSEAGMVTSWFFDKIDPAQLDDIEEITEVEGSLDDGYYFINFSNYNKSNVCMVPILDGETWRLGAYTRNDAEFDPSYVWHVTKNADGTYAFKNCGKQDLTFVENVGKGDKESPYILMTGLNPASFKLQFLSNGCAYIFSTDNKYNYAINIADGFMHTSKSQNVASMVKFVPVPADKTTNSFKLNEAITTALGKQFTVGANPGQVSQEDYDTFSAVLKKAQAAASSEDDHSALIAELNAATETLQGKIIPIEEGYYTFKDCAYDEYLKPFFKYNEWYLGHDAVDPLFDASAVWHVIKNADGNLVLKNCGTQDSTYIVSSSSGNNWGLTRMAGTSKTYNTFKQQYSNVFKLYASDNGNFWNADGGNVVSSNNDYHPQDGVWLVEKVADADIPLFSKLNEAITDAAGAVKDSKVGPNPGDHIGDATEINAVIAEARTMYDEASASDGEVDGMIAKLAEAAQKFNEQDHSMRGVEDGYYYIVSNQDGFQEQGKIAMHVTQDTYVKWRVLNNKDPRYLFKIKNNGDDTYSIQSELYGTYVDKNGAGGIGTSPTPATPQKITYKENSMWWISNDVDGKPYALQTHKTELTGILTPNADNGAINLWRLVKITDTKLLDSLINVSKAIRLAEEMDVAVKKAEPAYKAVFRYDTDYSNKLITETNEENPLEGQVWGTEVGDAYSTYEHLIDGDLNTCFQSSWDQGKWGSKVEEGKGQQWLQVDLRDNPVNDFEFYFGLRNNDWGWKECWSNIDVYATNDASVANKESVDPAEWTNLGNYTDLTSYIRPENASINSHGRYINYRVSGNGQEYRYLRFMVRSTIDPQSCMMYTIGEFQVYKVEYSEANSPYEYIEGLKPLADELKQLIDAAKTKIAEKTATREDIDKIIEITAKVDALTPKTEPLDNKIAEVRDYIAKFTDGEDWGDVTTEQYEAILGAIDDADAYDHEQPQQADIESRLAALNTALALYKSQQKLPAAGTWYYISNTDNTRPGYAPDGDGGTSSSIYERFSFGNVIMAPRTNATRDRSWTEADYVKWGGYDHLGQTICDSIPTDPYSMWRLVKIEGNNSEGVYALQNRATGTYLGVTSNHNGAAGMSVAQVPYKLSLLKSGQFNITCADASNTDNIPLHADGRRQILSWGGSADSPSSWTFEAVDETEIESGEITIRNNSATILTLPYAYDSERVSDLNTENGVSTYAIKGVSEDGSKLLLYSKLTFEAGEPMIVIAGDIAKYEESNEGTRMFLPLANEFTTEVKAANGIIGTLDYTKLPANTGIIKGASVVSTEDGGASLIGQRGYIDAAKIVNDNEQPTDVELSISGIINNINAAATTAKATRVNVYTIDGVLVKKNVKPANAKDGLKKGVYIIGKNKVLVK